MPAISLFSGNLANAGNESVCFRHFSKDGGDAKYLEGILKIQKKSGEIFWEHPFDPATKHDFTNFFKNQPSKSTPPHWLSFLCHGKADEVDPFSSKLEI